MARGLCLLAFIVLSPLAGPAAEPLRDDRNPLFASLTDPVRPATLIAYTPSALDPRNPANQSALKTSSIRADLMALRPAFDGLVLYGYHEACTPRILELAVELQFRVVLLAIWDPRSAAEVDGVLRLVALHDGKLALGILVGNEGLTFQRYETDDLTIASRRLRASLPSDGRIPLATSEPLVGYEQEFVRKFGDFLAPNIHPVFDRPALGPDEAAEWVRGEARRLAETSGKPVLVKETGFPHAGKSVYTPDSQRAFWAACTRRGRLSGTSAAWTCHNVAFEAFDLPWKSEASGLEIEKSWGLFAPTREPYPAVEVWKSLKTAQE